MLLKTPGRENSFSLLFVRMLPVFKEPNTQNVDHLPPPPYATIFDLPLAIRTALPPLASPATPANSVAPKLQNSRPKFEPSITKISKSKAFYDISTVGCNIHAKLYTFVSDIFANWRLDWEKSREKRNCFLVVRIVWWRRLIEMLGFRKWENVGVFILDNFTIHIIK